MDLATWVGIAEIVGSAAIVASLVFVGVQVSQNTRATRADTHQGLLNYWRATQEMLITQPDIFEWVTKAENEPDTLNELEHARFNEFVSMRWSAWEAAYNNLQDGMMDAAHYAGWEGYFAGSAGKPGYQAYWRDNGDEFIEPLKSYIESIILKGKVSSGE